MPHEPATALIAVTVAPHSNITEGGLRDKLSPLLPHLDLKFFSYEEGRGPEPLAIFSKVLCSGAHVWVGTEPNPRGETVCIDFPENKSEDLEPFKLYKSHGDLNEQLARHIVRVLGRGEI